MCGGIGSQLGFGNEQGLGICGIYVNSSIVAEGVP